MVHVVLCVCKHARASVGRTKSMSMERINRIQLNTFDWEIGTRCELVTSILCYVNFSYMKHLKRLQNCIEAFTLFLFYISFSYFCCCFVLFLNNFSRILFLSWNFRPTNQKTRPYIFWMWSFAHQLWMLFVCVWMCMLCHCCDLPFVIY